MPRAIVNGDTLANISGGGVIDRDFGDGSLGDVTIMSSMDLQGDLPYNTLVVNDGVRVSAVALTKLTIRTRGDLTLNGSAVIDAHGRGYPASTGGAGGEGGTDSIVAVGDETGASADATTRLLSGPAFSGAGGGGGGGGATATPPRPGGDGGGGGSGLAPGINYRASGVESFSLIQRNGLVQDFGVPVSSTVTIPAGILLSQNGDSVQFRAAGRIDFGGIESYRVFLDEMVVLSVSTGVGADWNVVGWVSRVSPTEVEVVVQATDNQTNGTGGESTKLTVDLSQPLDLRFESNSSGATQSVYYALLWRNDTSSAGVLGGLPGVGAGPSSSVAPTAGLPGTTTPSVDADLRARIETQKDYRALSTAFWGSPGGGGAGGGGAIHNSTATGSLGGAGGGPGSQAGPLGFGNAGNGDPGGDVSVVTSNHATGGGGGGAGGAGGGDLEVWCNGNLTIGSGSINANGGNGGDGGRGGNSTNGTNARTSGGGGGGGAGGSGGTVLVVVNGSTTNVSGATVTASGGNGGLFGVGGTTDDGTPLASELGANGASGRDGEDGFAVLIGV